MLTLLHETFTHTGQLAGQDAREGLRYGPTWLPQEFTVACRINM